MDEKNEKYIQMIIENSQSCKSAHHRIDKLEDTVQVIQELAVSVKEIAMETKANREDVNKIDLRLGAIEQKPSRNWDKIVSTAIGTITGVIAGGLIGLIIK